MQVHYGLDNSSGLFSYTVVTSGTFDGVHIGHQKILSRLNEVTLLAQKNGEQKAESVVITYHPHPRLILFPQQTGLYLLTTLEEKINLLAKFGIHHLVIIPFDAAFSQLSSATFIEEILVKKLDNVAISSTKIRNALMEGKVEIAKDYLGYTYALTGTVVRGKQIGRTMDYPTANLHIEDVHKLIPADGIYAVKVRYNSLIFSGMLYIGTRTTLGENLERTIEVNIFDFAQEIYGEILSIDFVALLRREMKFESIDQMKQQLHQDKRAALEILNV